MSKHSDSHDAVNAFQACLSFLPSSSTERILKQLKRKRQVTAACDSSPGIASLELRLI